jgi:putative hemolysin
MTLSNIILIFVLIALNAFFVGVEFSVVAGRRIRLDLLIKEDSPTVRMVRTWLEVPAERDKLIAANQLGITIVSLALGAVGENTFAAWLEPFFKILNLPAWLQFMERILPALPLIISLAVVTTFHVVLGEQVPKVAVLRGPEKYLLRAEPFMNVFVHAFRWFVNLLDWLTHRILGLFGLPASSTHAIVFSSEEIKQIVTGPETKGVIEDPEREMISAVLDFGELIVRQVLIPRMDIIAVPADMPLNEVAVVASKNLVTKLPVYEGSLEQIIGIVHVLDILCALQEDQAKQNQTARDIAREALFVPETISVNDLLFHFRTRRKHMAIVLDEFGGTAGLVTLEALLQEIVGEVQDVFDVDTEEIQTLGDGSVRLDGMAMIEEVNEHLGLNLDDPNYDTIAGYLLGKLGHIPKIGEVLEDKENGILLKVDDMDKLRIAHIILKRI